MHEALITFPLNVRLSASLSWRSKGKILQFYSKPYILKSTLLNDLILIGVLMIEG